MKMRSIFFIAAAFLLAAVPMVHGHGGVYGIYEGNAVAVHFGYAGGEPMSYAEAKVFGPDSSPDLEFQNGRTDARGIFAFVPDQPGSWKVEATDNQGHRGRIEITIEQDDAVLRAAVPEDSVNTLKMNRILLALSISANLVFAVAMFKSSKQSK